MDTRRTADLAIFGMTCAACATRLAKVLNRLPGLTAHVNLATERARLSLAAGASGVDAAIEAVRKAGYDAQEITGESRAAEKARHEAEYRRERRLFWISAVLTLPLMLQMPAMLAGGHHEW